MNNLEVGTEALLLEIEIQSARPINRKLI